MSISTAAGLNGAEVLPAMTPAKPNAAEASKSARGSKPNRAGRFQTLNAFVDVSIAGLCRGDIAVWLVLYRDTKNGTARTGQTDIARHTGMSVRGVAKSLRRLEVAGLLRVVYRGGLNRGASRYRVLPVAEGVQRGEVLAQPSRDRPAKPAEPMSSCAQRNSGRTQRGTD